MALPVALGSRAQEHREQDSAEQDGGEMQRCEDQDEFLVGRHV
jgi:hypothetical protein